MMCSAVLLICSQKWMPNLAAEHIVAELSDPNRLIK